MRPHADCDFESMSGELARGPDALACSRGHAANRPPCLECNREMRGLWAGLYRTALLHRVRTRGATDPRSTNSGDGDDADANEATAVHSRQRRKWPPSHRSETPPPSHSPHFFPERRALRPENPTYATRFTTPEESRTRIFLMHPCRIHAFFQRHPSRHCDDETHAEVVEVTT